MTQKIYNEQSYIVEVDMGNPVTIEINVWHQNQTELTRDEIIEEAIGYAEEIDVSISENDISGIITRVKK